LGGIVSDVDVDRIIASLDLTLFSQRGDEVYGLCPMHKERTGQIDHNPSWWINLTTGQHMCFSCKYKGNLYTLVRDLNPGMDHWDILDILKTEPENPTDLLKRLQDLPQYVGAKTDEIPMSEARMAVYIDPPAYALERRNISLEAAQHYGVKWDDDSKAWITPLRDPHFGELMGWQEKAFIGRFFRNYPAGVSKGRTLFGVNVQEDDIAIVVESPLDCLRLYTAGFKGGLAVCGSVVNEGHAKILRYSSKIIAAFDCDKAGVQASEELFKFAKMYGLDVSFFNYSATEAKDPGDMTDDEIRFGIENARNMIYGEKAYKWDFEARLSLTK
jgi:5S rRNA maturation endonuclease (ribonuclease M5)